MLHCERAMDRSVVPHRFPGAALRLSLCPLLRWCPQRPGPFNLAESVTTGAQYAYLLVGQSVGPHCPLAKDAISPLARDNRIGSGLRPCVANRSSWSEMNQPTTLELGAWIGKGQAFGLMRNRCSAAQAECLKLIQRLDEFGADYFRLSGLTQINPDTYRAISDSIADQHIEIDGERVPITPENGRRIRIAIAEMRTKLLQAQELQPTCSSVTDLQFQLDNCFSVIRRLLRSSKDAGTRASMKGLISYSIGKLNHISKEFPA